MDTEKIITSGLHVEKTHVLRLTFRKIHTECSRKRDALTVFYLDNTLTLCYVFFRI